MPVLLSLLLNASAATPFRLQYDEGTTGCPGRAQLASAVRVRLGWDPFVEDAADLIEVQLRRVGETLTARVVRKRAGGAQGERELSSPTTDCTELFRALEFAVALSIDPRVGLVRPSPPLAPPAPRAEPPATAPPPPVSPVTFFLGPVILGGVGTGPTPTLGFGLLFGLRHELLELGLGGRVELPSQLGLAPGSLTTQVLAGHATACLAVSVVRACALGELGAVRLESAGVAPGIRQTALLADLGVRLALHFRVLAFLAVRPFAELTAALVRTTVLVDGRPAWTTSPVAGVLGLALLLSLEDGLAPAVPTRSER